MAAVLEAATVALPVVDVTNHSTVEPEGALFNETVASEPYTKPVVGVIEILVGQLLVGFIVQYIVLLAVVPSLHTYPDHKVAVTEKVPALVAVWVPLSV